MLAEEVLKRIEKPKNGNAIERGALHSRRMRFHSDATLSLNDAVGTYLTDFKLWVEGILPQDKYDRFCSLISYPLPTNELLESIYTNLSRVFEGEDATVEVAFVDQALTEEASDLFESECFRRKAFRAMQSCIDTIVVLDMPQEPDEDGKTKPYYYFVPISNVIDLDVEGDDINYLIFRNGTGQIYAMDEEFLRVFTDEEKPKMITEVENPFPCTPARMLWSTNLTTTNDINKKSPITSVLGDLDALLFDMVSRRYAELYGKYPIIVSYEIAKDYSNEPFEERTDGKGNAKGKLLGAGSNITNPAPQSRDEFDMNSNAVKFINADVSVMEFIDKRIDSDKQRIFESVVGVGGDALNNQAQNEKQVKAGFENKIDVINRLKHNFEEIEEWVIETIMETMYPDQFIDCEVDYGTRFYLTSESEIVSQIGNAVQNNVSDSVIETLTDEYLTTKYKTDSGILDRFRVIQDIDPFPGKTAEQVVEMFTKNPALFDESEVRLKINLDRDIKRFERENMSLSEFGNNFKNYRKKIETIINTLKGYESKQS